MKKTLRILFLLLIIASLGYYFYYKSQQKDSVLDLKELKRSQSSEQFDLKRIPREELFAPTPEAQAVLTELKSRFRQSLVAWHQELQADSVKLIYCWITTEVGVSETAIQRESKTFVASLCRELDIPFVDFDPLIAPYQAREITFMPKDGHFNPKGVELISGLLADLIRENDTWRSSLRFSEAERPRYFGDLEPGQDAIKDGGKNLPYRFITNNQGLRMDRPVRFDNPGQRVLLMGDSGFYFPFIDNDQTATHLLQQRFPAKEILNVANWGYTITDFRSLYRENARFLEPDLILLQSSGDDLADLYFTHQRRFARDKERSNQEPSAAEKRFHRQLEEEES